MTREEARNVFGGSIVNNLLSLGAEPTNVVRQDGLIEWKSDGYIEVGGVQVWAYYYWMVWLIYLIWEGNRLVGLNNKQ